MHSSKMHTARLVTISGEGGCLLSGVSALGGGVCLGRGCLPWERMSALGGDVCQGRGFLPGEGVSARGGGFCQGRGFLPGGCLPGGCTPINRIVDTRLGKHYVLATTVAGDKYR